MRLPKDIITHNYTKPRVFLCQPNKEKICQLDVTDLTGSFKFNSYSEITFEVARTYNDFFTGEMRVNPHYDEIEAFRLIYLEHFGYFELQGPELTSDGIKETKLCTAYSLEYILSQKYLEDFYVNTGAINSVEVTYSDLNNKSIVPVTLYNPNNTKLSLLHLILEKDYANWKIGHIDSQLCKLSRQFEVDRESIYDFLMNEVCEKFNCYIEFDTIDNTINIYAESPTAKFISTGATRTFKIGTAGNAFSEVKTVSIDGYKITGWSYGIVDNEGILVLAEVPAVGSKIEVVGVDSKWETDVFITFDNLSQEVKIDYDAESIKTVLTVTFGDDHDIREVNLGLPYIVDLSYYCTPEWMGQQLYDDWLAYQQKCESKQSEYTKNSQDMLYYAGQIDYEENRMSLGFAEITVSEISVGTYYVRGGTPPNYYYTEVSLPSEYDANTVYYSPKTTAIEDGSDGNISKLYTALQKYFMYVDDWKTDLDALAEEFEFLEGRAIENLSLTLSKVTTGRDSPEIKSVLQAFLVPIWDQVGRTVLKTSYYEPYKTVQITNMEAGWSQKSHAEYGNYYATIMLLNSMETALNAKDKKIQQYKVEYNAIQGENANISNELLMTNHFDKNQLATLNAFLREDELHLDYIVQTSQDSVTDTYKNQHDALESAKIELKKLSQPQLQFSMSMANIYALPEFEPIVDQFQLGNIVKVGLRSDYIKQSRLIQVDINFDDFSDFSCTFGELTNLRTQSDIHADLLKNAITAGKSVAQNASYWTKGSDQANSIDLRLQEGLLNSIEALKATGGNQNAYMDKYGIHLESINPNTGEVDDKRIWMVNNQIVFTDDGFTTSKAVLGEFTIGEESRYGLLADAVIAGLVEGSDIRGGTIQIGDRNDGTYTFEVDQNGHVTLNAASISGYVTSGEMQSFIEQTDGKITSKVTEGINKLSGKIPHYGDCGTPADMKQKVVNCGEFELEPNDGDILVVKFNEGNTADSPTLRVPYGTEGRVAPIYAYGFELTKFSSYNWGDNTIVTFVYDDGAWHIADNNSQKVYSQITQTAEKIESEVSATYATKGQVAHYGTCTTAANTAVKTVTCDNFDVYTGASISVRFTHKNSADYPRLKINDKTAYIVETIDNVDQYLLKDSPSGWDDNSLVTFVYDGTDWRIADAGSLQRTYNLSSRITQTESSIESVVEATDGLNDRMSTVEQTAGSIKSTVTQVQSQVVHYGTCSTESNEPIKVVSCTGFSLYKGATISVKFNYTNSANAPQLNVNNTGAKNIASGEYSALSSSSKYNWSDNAIVAFVYDGTYWRISGTEALHRTTELSSEIKQTADKISFAVKEVSGETGTEFELNNEAVRMAWNQSNDYIVFENGEIKIYTSSTHTSNTLFAVYNKNGAWYHDNGTTVGKIGTNYFEGHEDYKGLVFDLEYGAGFMSWGVQEEKDGNYVVKLAYYTDTTIGNKGFNFNDKVYFDWSVYCNSYLYCNSSVYLQENAILWLSDKDYFTQLTENNKGVGMALKSTNKYAGLVGINTQFLCGEDYHFAKSKNAVVYCNNNINLSGAYSVVNQSDARLKTNIKDAELDALKLIRQIEMKEFDWIENGEHEELGMIAQQLQSIAPNLVHTDPNTDILSIKTDKLIHYLIKAVQELYDMSTHNNAPHLNTNKKQPWHDEYSLDAKSDFVKRTNGRFSAGELAVNDKKSTPDENTRTKHTPIILPRKMS